MRDPVWINMAAMPWSHHDHGEVWSRLCHDNGMAAMFLSMVVMIHGMITMLSMIHTMIMVWSSCFPCFFWKKNGLSVLSQIVAAISHFMTGRREYYAFRLPIQQNGTMFTTELELFSEPDSNKFLFNNSSNITFRWHLFVIFGNFDFLGKIFSSQTSFGLFLMGSFNIFRLKKQLTTTYALIKKVVWITSVVRTTL